MEQWLSNFCVQQEDLIFIASSSQRGEDGRDKGNCVISQSASVEECSERPETWGQQSSVEIITRWRFDRGDEVINMVES